MTEVKVRFLKKVLTSVDLFYLCFKLWISSLYGFSLIQNSYSSKIFGWSEVYKADLIGQRDIS